MKYVIFIRKDMIEFIYALIFHSIMWKNKKKKFFLIKTLSTHLNSVRDCLSHYIRNVLFITFLNPQICAATLFVAPLNNRKDPFQCSSLSC